MSTTLDRTFIKELMGDDDTLVDRFINIFKHQCPQQLQELIQHHENRDWLSLSNVAHSMKTQFKYLSLDTLAAQIVEIEIMADEGDTAGLGLLIQAFEKEFDQFMQSLG